MVDLRGAALARSCLVVLVGCSMGPSRVHDPEAAEIARASGVCGSEPSLVAVDRISGREIHVTCAIGVPGVKATKTLVAECADGQWQIQGGRDLQTGPPCLGSP